MSWHKAHGKRRTSLEHSDRKSEVPGVGVGTRLLRKPSDLSGAQNAWRDWSTVFKGYAGAAIPRLQELMDNAAKATEPTPNATIIDDKDRAASAQLCWMMLMICKGAALNTVFLAGDSEGLEAWRQLTDKYEPKMRTRLAGQLMSILSYSFQGDTTERITAWEREMATYERDSGKIIDDENQGWCSVARIARITAENPFADACRQTEKADRLPRRSGCDFPCNCRCSVTADTDGHWSSGQGEIRQGWQGIERIRQT